METGCAKLPVCRCANSCMQFTRKLCGTVSSETSLGVSALCWTPSLRFSKRLAELAFSSSVGRFSHPPFRCSLAPNANLKSVGGLLVGPYQLQSTDTWETKVAVDGTVHQLTTTVVNFSRQVHHSCVNHSMKVAY